MIFDLLCHSSCIYTCFICVIYLMFVRKSLEVFCMFIYFIT